VETIFAFKPLRYFISTPSAGAEAFFVHLGQQGRFFGIKGGKHEQISAPLVALS
jgi:hypothetical protein